MGEWRKGRRGGVVKKRKGVAVGISRDKSNRPVKQSNVRSKAVDTIQSDSGYTLHS